MKYLYYPIYDTDDIKSILDNGIMTDNYDEVVLYERPYGKPVENAKNFAKVDLDKILEDGLLSSSSSIYDYKTYEHNNTEICTGTPISPEYIRCII